MTRPWHSISTREIDRAVERQHERALSRYEAEQDRASFEAEWCSRHRCLRDDCECDRPWADEEDRAA